MSGEGGAGFDPRRANITRLLVIADQFPPDSHEPDRFARSRELKDTALLVARTAVGFGVGVIGKYNLSRAVDLLDRAGLYLQADGYPKEAMPILDEALAALEDAHLGFDLQAATVLQHVAMTASLLGNPVKALAADGRALGIRQNAPGTPKAALASLSHDLGVDFRDLGVQLRGDGYPGPAGDCFRLSLGHHGVSLRLRARDFLGDPEPFALGLLDRATTLLEMHETDQAARDVDHAFKILTLCGAPMHAAHSRRASVRQARGDLVGALADREAALEGTEKIGLRDDHPRLTAARTAVSEVQRAIQEASREGVS